ncbi:DUF6093 family protein [Segeticoccus rhizosphaerae]|uniref:DUF6093 family protein n=1 Tax=Segeticoccus rhizosphaerae TaxID=1104777 RepID=UPI0010C0C62A|nr:DUF6093 family protein [Ornithinicoccus soli]
MRPNLALLRSRLATRLTETGKVLEQTGTETSDVPPFDEVPVYATHYEGPILVRPQDQSRVVEAGGASYTVSRYDVTMPADTNVVNGWTIEVTVAPFDPALVGQKFTVLDVPLDAWQVARTVVAARVT